MSALDSKPIPGFDPDKQAVTDAVIEDYLEDLVESVSTWNELRAFGETPSELKNCVSMLRRALYTASGDPRPMFSVLEELGLRDRFATQAVREVVACIQNYIVSEYMAYRTIHGRNTLMRLHARRRPPMARLSASLGAGCTRPLC